MTYAIVYSSKTGNTALLAKAAAACLPQGSYCGDPCAAALAADTVLVGFWTDKGSCDESIATFLQSCYGKNVFLFGTAGFGGDPAYFAQILERAAANLPADSKLIGSYMCQGKMPMPVRARYEAMAAQDPAKFQPMLDNFDRALSHPDQNDLDGMAAAVKAVL